MRNVFTQFILLFCASIFERATFAVCCSNFSSVPLSVDSMCSPDLSFLPFLCFRFQNDLVTVDIKDIETEDWASGEIVIPRTPNLNVDLFARLVIIEMRS